MLEPLEQDFMPYGPGARTVAVINRIHEGKSGSPLTPAKLAALGVAEGNAVRVQRSLYFLGLIDEEGNLTEGATRLRKAASGEYAEALAEIIRDKYAPIIEMYDPATATGLDLNNAFRQYEPAGQKDNMIRLYTALCQEAGLMPTTEKKRGRPLGSKASDGSAKLQKNREQARTNGTTHQNHPPPAPSIVNLLVSKFPDFNPEWESAVQERWFQAFSRLQEELKK